MNAATQDALIPASFEYTDPITKVTETIELQLRRMAFNKAMPKRLRAAIDDDDTVAMSEVLSHLVEEWNLDWNGDPFPPNVENIGSRPTEFVGELAECVFRALNPNPTQANSLDNGSEQPTSSLATDPTSDSSSDGN